MEVNIAIVDDDQAATDKLKSFLKKFTLEPDMGDVHFNINTYSDGMAFLTSYPANSDIVLMDIDMPKLDGMKAAEKLRELDSFVVIIFVTNLLQYAVKGYEVDAQDFLVKPVFYPSFAMKIRRALAHLKLIGNEKIQVYAENGINIFSPRTIKYVEVMKHDIVYHTTNGDVRTHGSLKQVEQKLGSGFVRCNNCYLVNLAYVDAVKDFTVVIGKDELSISRLKKKEFLAAIADYYGGRN